MSQISAEAINESVVRKWKRYPAYKNSGVEWLGEIPAHWEVCALRRKLRIGSDGIKIGPFGSQLKLEYMKESGFKVYGQEHIIAGNFTLGSKYIGEEKFSELAVCSVHPGDLLVTMMGTSGRCQLVPPGIELGLMDSHLLRLRVRDAELEPRFVAILIDQAYYVREQLKASGKGTIMHGLNSSLVKEIVLAIPSVPEQQTIATFLDRETAKIDTLIAKKEQLIQLLQEKRTALISHTVTKGLNPDTPMKDSGVEWLGEIPAHWSIKRVKYCLQSIEQGWSPSCENRIAEDDEWGVLKVGCVNGTEFNPEENKALPKDLEPRSELEIKPGDVLISRANTRELLGSASVVKTVRPRLLLCDKLYRLKVNISMVNLDYLVLSLSSAIARFQMERDATGASNSMQNIGQDSVLNLVLPLPDSVEQQAIASYLDHETTKIDALIAKIRTGIEQLKEYRTALISSAVTGKIDVRDEVK